MKIKSSLISVNSFHFWNKYLKSNIKISKNLIQKDFAAIDMYFHIDIFIFKSFNVSFLLFGRIHYLLEGQNSNRCTDKDQEKHNMVEIFSDHIESFIRSISDQEKITSIAKSKDGGLHVSRAKNYLVQSSKTKVITEEVTGLIGQEIGVFREFFTFEEVFGSWSRSSGAYKISFDGIELILSSDDEQISSGKGHFTFTDFHVFDIDRWSKHFLLKYSSFFALLRFVCISFEVITEHI